MEKSNEYFFTLDTDGKDKVMVIGDYFRLGSMKAEIFDGVAWEVLDNLPVTMSYVNAVLHEGKIIITGNQQLEVAGISSHCIPLNIGSFLIEENM